MRRIMKQLRLVWTSKFDKRPMSVTTTTENDSVDAVAAAENVSTDSLDPETRMGDMFRGVVDKAKDLPDAYEEGRVNMLFAKVAEWMQEIRSAYLAIAEPVLSRALAMARIPFSAVVLNIDQRNNQLKIGTKAVLSKRANRLEELRLDITRLGREIRELTIGIFGRPDFSPAKKNYAADTLVVIAAIGISFWLDTVFNSGLLWRNASPAVALAFSATISLAGSLSSYWAADAKKEVLDHEDAERQKDEAFKDNNGDDPVTGKEARVFPISARTMLKSRFNHALFIGICISTVVFRTFLSSVSAETLGDVAGDVAGSFGPILVLATLYAFKLFLGTSSHPRERELNNKRKEKTDAEAEAKRLENLAGETETARLFEAYNIGIDTALATNRNRAQTRKRARARFVELAGEFNEAPPWSMDRYDDAVENLVRRLGNATETREEMDAAVDQARPKFPEGLPFNLGEATNEMNAMQNAEPDATNRTVDFESFRQKVWNEALTEAKAATEAQRREDEAAAQRAADGLARNRRARGQAAMGYHVRPRRTR